MYDYNYIAGIITSVDENKIEFNVLDLFPGVIYIKGDGLSNFNYDENKSQGRLSVNGKNVFYKKDKLINVTIDKIFTTNENKLCLLCKFDLINSQN